MEEVECHIGLKNVACRAVGVGAVPFLQNHYPVPDVVVHEVNPEVGTCHCPPLASLHWEHYRPGRSREGDPI